MSTVALGQELGEMICDKLGLDKDLVRHIDLHMGIGEIAIITIERFLTQEDVDEAFKIIEGYTLELLSADAEQGIP